MPDHTLTVAVLADIHGNLPALTAVLTDLRTQKYDQIVIAGDLAMNGPYPAETLACIRALAVPTIIGNVDLEVIEAEPSNSTAWWTQQKIGRAGVSYLAELPHSYRVSAPTSASELTDLLIVHATPRSAFDVLILEPHPLGTTFTEETPQEEARRMLAGQRADLIVYGHIHYASSGMVEDQPIVSIGSVGFPFDGNHAAAYALIAWDGLHWQITHRRVDYDYERVVAAVYASGQPFPDTYAQRLRQADWCPTPPRPS